jgi:hypothetical protein
MGEECKTRKKIWEEGEVEDDVQEKSRGQQRTKTATAKRTRESVSHLNPPSTLEVFRRRFVGGGVGWTVDTDRWGVVKHGWGGQTSSGDSSLREFDLGGKRSRGATSLNGESHGKSSTGTSKAIRFPRLEKKSDKVLSVSRLFTGEH